MSFSEWSNKKKKKEQEEERQELDPRNYNSFTEWSNAKYGVVVEDIAPVVSVAPTTTSKESKEKDGWFQKSGLFDDGWQFGDVTKAILGSAQDVDENIWSGVLGMGEKVVDALAYIAPYAMKAQYNNADSLILDQNTQKAVDYAFNEAQKANAGFIAKDLYDEEKVAKWIVSNTSAVGVNNKRMGVDVETDSVFGAKSDALVQSAGQLAAQFGLSAVGVPWFVTSGVTSFGSETENALNQGASYEEAGLSAAITAGAEILTEKLFGGDLFTKSGGLDIATKRLATGISNKVVRKLAKFGLDTAGEGFEEAASQFISRLGTSLYKEENLGEILFSEEALEEYLDSAIGGVALGGVMGGVNAVTSKGDYVTGLTKNETAVVDKVYKDALAEKEKGGKKVSAKDKADLYESIVRDMERGRISTDTIEEVLGGESYKAYKDAVSKEEAAVKEFSELYEGDELKQQVDDFMKTAESGKLKEQLSKGVFELTKGDKVSESYREQGRRYKAFEADLTQYDEKQRKVVQRAIDSGILNNTNATHEFVDFVAKISADTDTPFNFVDNKKLSESGFAVAGKTINGFELNGEITVNINAAKSLDFVVGHEITHALEDTELYEKLKETLFAYAKNRKAMDSKRFDSEYKERMHDAIRMYKNVKGYEGANGYAKIKKEVVADLVGDYLFSDPDFVRHLHAEDRNMFQKIWDEIKYLYKVATAGSQEARELERVKKAFEDAYREGGKGRVNTDANIFADSESAKVTANDYTIVETLLNMDRVNNTNANEVINDEALTKAFESMTGVTLEGTTVQKREQIRKAVKDYQLQNAENVANAKEVKKQKAVADKQVAADKAMRSSYNSYIRGILTNGATVSDAQEILRKPEVKELWESVTGKHLPENGKSAVKMIMQTKRKPENIKLPNVDAKYSLSGNTENGSVTVYHGSKADFDSFDFTKLNDELGVFFAEGEEGAKQYGNAKAYTLTPKKTLVVHQGEEYRRLMQTGETDAEKRKRFISEGYDTIKLVYNKPGGGETVDWVALTPDVINADSSGAKYSLSGGNGAEFNGKPFWSGSVSLIDGVIEEVHSYEEAESTDFHHSMYFSESQVEKMASGENGFFFVDGGKVYGEWRDDVPKNIIRKIEGQITKYSLSDSTDIRYSLSEIVDQNHKSYGVGVHLDSELLDNLTTSERKVMVKEYVKELGGESFTAYDNEGKPVDVTIAKHDEKFKNKSGKIVPVNKDLTSKHIDIDVKQEAIALVDELIVASEYDDSKAPNYPHGWLDNDGQNKWEYWTTYIQDKKNTIWEATLNVANAADGRKILYDIGPIKKVGRSVKSDALPTNKNIPQDSNGVKLSLSENASDSTGKQLTREQSEFFKDSKVRDADGSLMVMYHGTPNGDFTVFKDGTYFTADKEYADIYQNPGASSISTGKVASNPKTFEVYLNITKPFDISDEEARRIYIEDYIKGGNAMGINPYLSDAEYSKIQTIDWTEGEDLREFLIEEGYDYDGLVLDEGGTGGYGDDVKSRGKSYVVFSSEQVKDVNNQSPTSDPDIRFSLSNPVEETKDLMAMHNLQASELIKSLELGGLPMPSVAIVKDTDSHDKYGDVSLILPKETIDPKANKANKVYGGDAWTPTYPRIEYKPSKAAEKRISDKYYELADKVGYDTVRPMYNYAQDLEHQLNSAGGEAAMRQELYEDTRMMQVYLEDSGKGKVEPVIKETRTEATEAEKEMNQWFIDKLGEDVIRSLKAPTGVNPMLHRKEFMEQYGEQVEQAYRDMLVEMLDFSPEDVNGVLDNTEKKDIMKLLMNSFKYLNNGGVTVRTETDYQATDAAIREAAADGYKAWVDDLFSGIEEKSGIRNNQDYYTPSGNPRSWDALHWANTLENVVKAMKGQDETGTGSFSPYNSFASLAHKRYGSIAEIKADSNRLGLVPEEEYEAMGDAFANRFAHIADSIKNPAERNPFIATEEAAELIVEAVRTQKTKAGLLSYLQKYNNRVTEQTVSDVMALVNDIANMPTGYFEAKPQRAVSFDEVGVFVIPNNADVKLKQELLNRGYSIAEYDPNIEGHRQQVVNQFEQYKFSLSDANEKPATNDGYRIYGKDLMLQPAADIAPVAPTAEAPVAPMPVQDSDEPEEPKTAPIGNQPIRTVEDRVAAQLQNVQTELANNQRLRAESNADFDAEIERLQAEYNGKQNKNSLVANDILRRIERKRRLKANADAAYAKRISDLEARVEKMNTPAYHTAQQRKTKQDQYTALMESLIGDTTTWVDKKLGLSYKTNTLKRNLRDVVRDAAGNHDIAKADAIYDELQGKYNHNEASLNRESIRIKKPYADMKLTKYEDAYVQMLGEFRHNPETTLTEDVVNEYYEKHKKYIDTAKVDKAIDAARETYDSLIQRVNDVLREQGMKEIPYRKGYFPHFTEEKQGFLAKLFNWKPQNHEIPTDIAGLTENFNPNRSWQSFNKQRKGDTTDYSFQKGLDTYVQGALDWIYHIEDIQKRRAFENYIRYIHSEQGVKDRIDAIRNSEDYDADEMQEQIDLVYAEARNPLNNFVTDLRAGTNRLANKKSSMDRGMEEMTNRRIYSTMTNLSNRVTANMVGGSISSALTNFIPITQSWGEVSPISSLRAMGDTIRSTVRDDGMIGKSDFLTNRLRTADKLYKTGWDKFSDAAGIMMDAVDSFTSQTVWRSKYLENISKGMSESEAIKNADAFAEGVMAGRSRGNMPTIFESKNPLIKMFTAFQLEVANQYGYMFKDMPQDMRNESKAKLVKGYATMFLGAYAYNALSSKLTGRDAAFDPIGIIEDLLRDLGLIGDDEEEPEEAVLNLVNNLAEEAPFIGGMLGGGRIPISSAMPYSGEYEGLEAFATDIAEGNWGKVAKEMLNPVYYLAMPVGGGQLKKTMEGLSMFSDDHPVAGSYTDSGNLRFPVEDTFGNHLQAGLFGQYANKNARDYFDNERSPLKEKQIQEYIDVDMPIRDYWDYREGLAKQDTLEDKFEYIADLDLPVEKKNILINNIVDRKDDVDMSNYDDFSNFEEFDWYSKNEEKYNFLQSNGVSYQQYKSSEDAKEKYDAAWAWYNNDDNAGKVTVSKVITDNVIQYRDYTSALNDIKADKDASGKTINGSGKAKKAAYIDSLDLDQGQKMILFRTLYDSKEDKAAYNAAIVDYLSSRDDLSYDEIVTILEELDMKVHSDGRVTW